MGLSERKLGVDSSPEALKEAITASLQSGEIVDVLWGMSSVPEDIREDWRRSCEFGLSLHSQFRRLFNTFSEAGQEKFREAVVMVVSDWSFDKHGPEFLGNLVYVAADTRALDAMPHFVGFVESDLVPNRDEREIEGTHRPLDRVIAVLAAFAPKADQVKQKFEEWLYNPAYDRDSALLLIGLCACSPDDYPKYFSRFLEVAKKHPQYFVRDGVIQEMIRVVTPAIVTQHLDELTLENRRLIEAKL